MLLIIKFEIFMILSILCIYIVIIIVILVESFHPILLSLITIYGSNVPLKLLSC